jgi:hypothetical protein
MQSEQYRNIIVYSRSIGLIDQGHTPEGPYIARDNYMKIPSKALLLSLANLAFIRPASALNFTRHAQIARQVQVIQDQFRMASTENIAPADMNGDRQTTVC